jgi:zinc transport system substrate-binding protein
MRRRLGALALTMAGLAALAGTARAEAPRVATDIAPVQSIVARVMAGVGSPDLVIPPGASPHGYALRPSEARALQDADLLVWVGPALTPWLAAPIDTLAPDAVHLALEDAPGVRLLPARTGHGFEAHVHGEHDHGHDNAGDHDHPDDHDHAGGHDHGETVDGHLWLAPANAAAAAAAIAGALAGIDPANAATYAANAEAFAGELDALSATIDATLAPVRGTPWLVFHDAFQYFEDAFDVRASGSIILQEGVEPGAARVAALRDRVREGHVVCAFTEPQFEPRLLATVIDGTAVRTGEIDDIGAALPLGPELYPTLLRGIADGLAGCLAGG